MAVWDAADDDERYADRERDNEELDRGDDGVPLVLPRKGTQTTPNK